MRRAKRSQLGQKSQAAYRAVLEPPAELGTANVERLHTLRHLIRRPVLVLLGQVGHLLEGHGGDVELFLVLVDQVLCTSLRSPLFAVHAEKRAYLSIVRAVKVVAGAVLARTGVVATDDEVRRAKVFTDDGVPDGFPGSTHTHGEREKGELGHAVRVGLDDGFVDSDLCGVCTERWVNGQKVGALE